MRNFEILPYDSNWKNLFELEVKEIQKIIGDNCLAIHHIGSTSILGLAAKPIIDILAIVKDISLIDEHSRDFEEFGYKGRGELGIPLRRFFLKGEILRTHHIHIFQENSFEIDRHLDFRDWLRSHPEDLNAYKELKISLAKKYFDDINKYCIGKDEFIDLINNKIKANKKKYMEK